MICKHKSKDGKCLIACEKDYIEYCHEGPCTKEQPMTNADRIRSMTDKELAKWIFSVTTDVLIILQIGSDAPTKSYFGWLTWLQQEVKE